MRVIRSVSKTPCSSPFLFSGSFNFDPHPSRNDHSVASGSSPMVYKSRNLRIVWHPGDRRSDLHIHLCTYVHFIRVRILSKVLLSIFVVSSACGLGLLKINCSVLELSYLSDSCPGELFPFLSGIEV